MISLMNRPMAVLAGLTFGVTSLAPISAFAAAAGGGGLPWDTPLQTLQQDLTGPTAFTIALVAFFAAGAMMIFGEEIHGGTRRLALAAMFGAFLCMVPTFMTALGIAGAIV